MIGRSWRLGVAAEPGETSGACGWRVALNDAAGKLPPVLPVERLHLAATPTPCWFLPPAIMSLTRTIAWLDLLHAFAIFQRLIGAIGNARRDILDHGANFFRGVRRFGGQRAYFAGNDRKATTMFACTGCFHGGIQRQDIGLEGDGVDHLNDFIDPFGATLTMQACAQPWIPKKGLWCPHSCPYCLE